VKVGEEGEVAFSTTATLFPPVVISIDIRRLREQDLSSQSKVRESELMLKL